MIVTEHAAERYRERVDPSVSHEQAMEALSGYRATIDRAAAFGCHCIRLGCGAKLVLDGETVVTVLSRRQKSSPRKVYA